MIEDSDAALKEQLASIELMHAVKRLQSNLDFQNVISRGYLNNAVLSAAFSLGTANEEGRKVILEKLVAASVFNDYLVNLTQQGEKALESKIDLSNGD